MSWNIPPGWGDSRGGMCPPPFGTPRRGSGLTSQHHDLLARVLAQEVLDQVVGHREELGGWGQRRALGGCQHLDKGSRTLVLNSPFTIKRDLRDSG